MTETTTRALEGDDPFAPQPGAAAASAGGDGPRDRPAGPGEPFPTPRQRLAGWWGRLADRWAEDPGRVAESVLSLVVVVLGTALVLATLHPGDLWRNTTPTGGDMGAHVWGPRYLRDELLPNLRLSGWSPDWYDGFPAYQFYMVVPSLLIVILNVGLPWYVALPVVLLAVAGAAQGWVRERLHPYRRLLVGAAALVVVLSIPIPYNRSFKLITALGLLGIPVACWAFAKLADLPFPMPPLASAAGLLFIYNREPLFNNTGNIIGGNFQSTMAGEFAFSISLTAAVLYLGVAARGLRTGRYRALSAGLFALAGLCHLIPAFFVLACTGALFLIHPDRVRLKWLATMVPVAGLLTAFWVLPFWWRRDFVNDMGWERLPAPNSEQTSIWYYLLPDGMKYLLLVAALGAVVSFVRRYTVGMVLAIAWAGSMIGFAALPQYRLWNARILPFEYLSVALLGAIGLGEVIRLAGAVASGRADRPLRPITVTVGALAALGVLVYVSLPLSGILDDVITREPVTVRTAEGTTETKIRSSFLLFDTTATNPVAGWSGWNYAGLERKVATPAGCDLEGAATPCTSGGWPEYRDLVATMADLGGEADHGCGRAFWEYDGDRINGYGTPMAPMLLPYWTDGCIGSQEGLYFESSTTVPYHFLMQAELSTKPSQPQRKLPYPGFDLDQGVRHLQLLGVKYYLAVTPQAVGAADQHPDLTEVAVSGPWHVYQVADAPLVEPLEYEPVVATGIGESQDEWLPTATAWFLDADRLDVPLAVEGPDDWKRVEATPVPEESREVVRFAREQLGLTGSMDRAPSEPRTKLPANEVTDIRQGNDSMSFTVDQIGVPVLVKASYFPNWKVSGADGPYRVTPNLMVVVPRQHDVSMTYGRTPIDLLGIAMTLLGLAGLVYLARKPPLAVAPYAAGRASAWIDRLVSLTPKAPPTDGDPDTWAPPDATGRSERPPPPSAADPSAPSPWEQPGDPVDAPAADAPAADAPARDPQDTTHAPEAP